LKLIYLTNFIFIWHDIAFFCAENAVEHQPTINGDKDILFTWYVFLNVEDKIHNKSICSLFDVAESLSDVSLNYNDVFHSTDSLLDTGGK